MARCCPTHASGSDRWLHSSMSPSPRFCWFGRCNRHITQMSCQLGRVLTNRLTLPAWNKLPDRRAVPVVGRVQAVRQMYCDGVTCQLRQRSLCHRQRQMPWAGPARPVSSMMSVSPSAAAVNIVGAMLCRASTELQSRGRRRGNGVQLPGLKRAPLSSHGKTMGSTRNPTDSSLCLHRTASTSRPAPTHHVLAHVNAARPSACLAQPARSSRGRHQHQHHYQHHHPPPPHHHHRHHTTTTRGHYYHRLTAMARLQSRAQAQAPRHPGTQARHQHGLVSGVAAARQAPKGIHPRA